MLVPATGQPNGERAVKQVAQNYRSGELRLLDVPVPACQPGGVLVRSRCSLISSGTELMKIQESNLSLVGKARARPDQVKKVVQSASQQGLLATYRKATNQLDSYSPLGYSLCGTVVEVGDGVSELTTDQRVACGGNLYALHAEFNWVPKNLCVAVPPGVSDADAAYATVGAIALHGFRRSEASLGESACVIGLGLVGQLLVQILVAASVHVVGLDPSEERCRLAERMGALTCAAPDGGAVEHLLAHLARTGAAQGADHIFLTAGGDTNQPVELAAALARDRARVTDIGKSRLELPWKDYYAKELEVRFSRSYGPGRYDPRYEEGGVDYPVGYVRWTEQRNMGAFLGLVETGRVDVSALTSAVVPFDEAVPTYERLRAGTLSGVGVVFRYADRGTQERRLPPAGWPPPQRSPGPRSKPVRLGVIGAGNYASTMLLPHLARRPDVRLVEVATATGLSARNAQRKFGFERCSTDYGGLLDANDVDAVLIATRHHLHAPMACEALQAGKTVFVEKPLAIDEEQLAMLWATVAQTGNDRLVVGFNRRFAPLLLHLHQQWERPVGPVQLRYDVNAGRLEPSSWYARREEAGGRLVGEGCHFVDTASWWLGADPVEVVATSTAGDPDDAVCTLTYPDGSVATISYITGGDGRYPKEVLQVFGGGRVARLHNFERTELWHRGRRRTKRAWRGIDKGQRQELRAFVAAVAAGTPMPIGLTSLLATTAATLAAERSIVTGRAEPIVPWPAPDRSCARKDGAAG
jgi:predicted dehydrogenase/threonine dehydrogenase-like Zn-dependent dehydrogenase